MKSSSKIRRDLASQPAVLWTPPDLDVNLFSPKTTIDKKKIIALFVEEGAELEKKSTISRSALKPAGTYQDFAVWTPDLGSWDSDGEIESRADVWDFVKMPLPELVESMEELEGDDKHSTAFSAPVPARDIEAQVAAILEDARAKAEELILSAQADADGLMLQAQTEIEELKNEQKKAGYEQGVQEARVEMEEALQSVRAMVREVDAWRNNLLTEGEPILIAMLKEVARKLFGDGVELDPHSLQSNLNRVMDSAHGLGGLNIFLNPKDARMLDSAWVDQQLLITGGQAKIIPSANITRGGCFIKGNMGTVDARVETQLEALLKAFDEARVRAD